MLAERNLQHEVDGFRGERIGCFGFLIEPQQYLFSEFGIGFITLYYASIATLINLHLQALLNELNVFIELATK